MPCSRWVRWPRCFFAALSGNASEPVLFSPSPVEMGPLTFTAKNWAGYVSENSFSSPQSDSVTAVGGSWIVPLTTPSANSGRTLTACSQWVGIDGFSNLTVEQVGTECTASGSLVSYHAWYEMYPSGVTTIPNFPVSPGDSITASVQYGLLNYPNQFQLSITDNTSGQTYTIYRRFPLP